MKKMMKCLVLAMAVLTVASTAWCWDFADHVKMAPNGQGDLLIYPFYAAGGGWETKITVINTSTNRSVVAHIAFYSARTSYELLDFFLFLTPTDVWTGTVRTDSTGNAEIYSTDDSVLISAGVFATTGTPLVKALGPAIRSGCNANAEPFGNAIGYMKVLEAAHTDNVASLVYPYPRGTTGTVNLNAPPVPKLALYNAFNDFLTAAGSGSTVSGSANAATNTMILGGLNVLAGYMDFRNPTSGQTAAINATVLRDYDNQLPVGYGQSIGFAAGCGYGGGMVGITPAAPPISPAYGGVTTAGCQVGAVLATSTNSWVPAATLCNNPIGNGGCGCAPNGMGCQSNSIGEVEAALAKDWLTMPITSKMGLAHIVTLPTKQTTRHNTDCFYVSSPSPFFNESTVGPTQRVTQPTSLTSRGSYSSTWDAWGCFPFSTASYDLSENPSNVTSIFSPGGQSNSLCGEMNLLLGPFAFDEGWAVYNFANINSLGTASYVTRFDTQANLNVNAPDAQYTGAPAIGTALSITSNGLTLIPASYQDGRVTNLAAGGVNYYGYQYWDGANINDVGAAGIIGATVPPIGDDELVAAGFCTATVSSVGGTPVACGVFSSFAAALPVPANNVTGALGNGIYQNKFAGNRAGLTGLFTIPASTATTTPATPMAALYVPSGTTITTTAALTDVPTGATTLIPVGTTTTAAAYTVRVPASTTITSSVTLGAPILGTANAYQNFSTDANQP